MSSTILDENRRLCCVFLSGCTTVQADRSTNALTEYVEFKDTNLKKCVVEELALQDEDSDVSKELLAEITELQCRSRGIIDIAAMEHATNLTSLDLEANEIVDVSPLAAPTNLELLDLHDRRISIADAVSGVPFTGRFQPVVATL